MGDDSEAASARLALYVIVVVVAVLIGTVLAPVVWSAAKPSPDDEGPSVAVVTLRGGTSPANVNDLTADLREARTDPAVEAVVLRIDSQGGAVTSSEEFYLAVNQTAREMPVVAYVEGTAASGGYYGIAPTDEIFVKPSSIVGSIGVIVQAPLSAVEQERRTRQTYLRTGPEKAMISEDSLRNEMETLHNAFLDTVMRHRGDELTLNRSQVARGDTYLGPEAVRNGFADRVGDLDAAIEHAAGLADGIDGDRYGVNYYEPVPQGGSGIVLGDADIEHVNGSIVYVDASDDGVEFRQPVRYYAVWGIPVSEDAESQEVVTNESG